MRLSLVLLLTLVMSGCQRLPPAPMPDHAEDLRSWQLSGRFGYRTGDDGGSASLSWEQQEERGDLYFSGPLGFGSAHIRWHPEGALLKTGKGEVSAAGPAELAWRLTGLWLPVEALEYWVRGLPWPGAGAQPQFGPTGQLEQLEQLGWQLEFDRYTAVEQLLLPFRIRARHGEQRFTLIIREWNPVH